MHSEKTAKVSLKTLKALLKLAEQHDIRCLRLGDVYFERGPAQAKASKKGDKPQAPVHKEIESIEEIDANIERGIRGLFSEAS